MLALATSRPVTNCWKRANRTCASTRCAHAYGSAQQTGYGLSGDARCGGWPLDGATRSATRRRPRRSPAWRELLLAAGARLDAWDVIGNTQSTAPRALATETSLAIAAQILDRAGTRRILLMNRLPATPVMYASVMEGRADVVTFLLSRGAVLEGNRPDPKMPLDTSMPTAARAHEIADLDVAAKCGNSEAPQGQDRGRK